MSTYTNVLDILDDTARQAGKTGAPMGWLHKSRYTWTVVLFQYSIVSKAKRNTRWVEESSLRLSGIARRLPKIASDVPAADLDHFLTAAAESEQAYLGMRKEVMDILLTIKPYAAKVPKVAQALSTMVEALADAFESAQDLRWVVMECQAQKNVDAGQVQRFGTAEAAIAALRA